MNDRKEQKRLRNEEGRRKAERHYEAQHIAETEQLSPAPKERR